MKTLTRLALAASALALFASAAYAEPSAKVWPQSYADLPPDPLIRFGVLPNGMRYAIMKNATPKGQASLRLRFDAGSLMETDAQQGLAHFLEHMAFNGSKQVPEGEMVKMLERLGLAFGADTNASTSWEETVYKLDLPHADAGTVDTSLMVLREAASELLIAQDAMDRERGVVLSEERVRDTPDYQAFKAWLKFALPGQLAADRFPIGQVEVLQDAKRDRIVDFYTRYYQPDRAVLIAVGDFDPDWIEAKIKARFSDWKPTVPQGAEPGLGAPEQRGPQAKVFTQPGASLSLQVGWVDPADTTSDSQVRRKQRTVEALGLAVLNRRLENLARTPEPPFIAAGADRDDAFRSARVTTLQVTAQPGRWKQALDAADAEQRRIVQFGVSQDELDREVDSYRAQLKAMVAGAATRKTSEIANDIASTVQEREVETSPAEDLALFEAVVKGLTAEQVGQSLKVVFHGAGPLVFLSSPDPIEGGDDALLAAFKAAEAKPVTALAAEAAIPWPYDHFGSPGRVVERKAVDDLGVTFVRFSNGVRLTVKPTKFRDDQVLVMARIGSGKLEMPKDRVTPAWQAGPSFIDGGLDKLTADNIDRVLRAHILGKDLSVDDDAFELKGSTRPADLELQLQLLAAYVAHPGWRPEAFLRMRSYGPTLHDQLESTASGVLERDLDGLTHSGDARFLLPTREQIAAAKPAELKALLEPALDRGPIEVLVVGDTTVEKAISLTAATFGALPARPSQAQVPPAERAVAFPAPNAEPVILRHKGRADDSFGLAAWPTGDFYSDMQRARTLAILSQIMELRLIDQVREAEGASYSPSADASASEIYPGFGFLSANVEIPPAKLPGFFADVDKIAADLRATDATADELERAKKPALERLARQRQTNEYWLNRLSGAQADPRKLAAVRSVVESLKRVTAEDVRKAAQTYLADGKAWRLEVLPVAK